MKFEVITIFPKMFDSPLAESILARARENKLMEVNFYNPRDFSKDKHRSVDDSPYGGGAGMVMRPEPIVEAVESVSVEKKSKVVLLSPAGKQFTQEHAREFATLDQLVLVCGRYEGVDERVSQTVVDEELSVGDYVLSGGELPAMLLIDAVTRLIPGALGNEVSHCHESFEEGLLEHPHYTKPREFRGLEVPQVLLEGHHEKIHQWRCREALSKTAKNRPDLLKSTKNRADECEIIDNEAQKS